MRYALLFALAGMGLSFAPKASAASFGCESVAGSVIFKDTLYGALTGTLISGLYILTQDKDELKNPEQIIAQGAAIGGGLGIGLGALEVGLRECPPARYGEDKPGLSTTFAAVPTPEGTLGAGWRVSWKF